MAEVRSLETLWAWLDARAGWLFVDRVLGAFYFRRMEKTFADVV